MNIAVFDSIVALFATKGILVILAILILLVGRVVINVLMKLFAGAMEKANVDASIRSFGMKALKAALYLLLALIILEFVGYEISSFAAIIASAGVTVGLALQGSLSNLAGGILILLMRPFQVGDYIAAAGYAGTVKEIGLMYTTLVTVDNHNVTVPNGALSGGSIENYSAQPTRRVDVQVNVSYATDLKVAKAEFTKVLKNVPGYLADQPVDVLIAELGAGNIVLEGRVWVEAGKYWDALFAARENVKAAYDQAGIKVAHSKVEILK